MPVINLVVQFIILFSSSSSASVSVSWALVEVISHSNTCLLLIKVHYSVAINTFAAFFFVTLDLQLSRWQTWIQIQIFINLSRTYLIAFYWRQFFYLQEREQSDKVMQISEIIDGFRHIQLRNYSLEVFSLILTKLSDIAQWSPSEFCQ